jgi:5-(carboxyamino)imidazole ribonucleotide synthase
MRRPVLEPGSVIGILGSGQLGRMLALSAARLGLKTHIYAPESGPAFDVTSRHSLGSWEDETALTAFARTVDIVTYEFENVPLACAKILEAHGCLRPSSEALRLTQDRLLEKTFLTQLGLPVAPFAKVDSLTELNVALNTLGTPSILKTRRFGYDGKGQITLRRREDAADAWQSIGGVSMSGVPCILEGFVPFSGEVSVVAARGGDGTFVPYDLCANHHDNHILSETLIPAPVPVALHEAAYIMAEKIGAALDYVGVFAVELFVTDEEFVVNEIAPRVHNSGHWTLDGAVTSQFEQHIRAICGWPLGSAQAFGAVTMRNLIGSDIKDWNALLQDPKAKLHLYGKTSARDGRKMGHVTFVEDLSGNKSSA